LGGFGFFRAEGDDAPFTEDEINAALAEMSEEELATFEEELTLAMADEEITSLAFADNDELAALADSDELASLAAAEDELFALAAEEEILAEEGATAFASEDERAAFLDAQFQIENELAAAASMEDGVALAAADTNTQLVSTAASTPSWAVALIVVGTLVGIALIVVQVTLVMLFRKRLPGKADERA